jgi:hypothetical protein
MSFELSAHAQDYLADAALRQTGLDRQQVGGATCQSVWLGDNQRISVAQICQSGVQF